MSNFYRGLPFMEQGVGFDTLRCNPLPSRLPQAGWHRAGMGGAGALCDFGEGESVMWIFFAFGSAFLAGITSILAKCGIQKTDSDAATAIRTVVVLLFAWLMVWVVGSAPMITSLSAKTWTFLLLSGLATGASGLCYFRALQLGDVNKVVPIDKSSTVLTILLAFFFLGEPHMAQRACGRFDWHRYASYDRKEGCR